MPADPYQSPQSTLESRRSSHHWFSWPLTIAILFQAMFLVLGLLFALLERQLFTLPPVASDFVNLLVILVVLGIFILPAIVIVVAVFVRMPSQAKLNYVLCSVGLSLAQILIFRVAMP